MGQGKKGGGGGGGGHGFGGGSYHHHAPAYGAHYTPAHIVPSYTPAYIVPITTSGSNTTKNDVSTNNNTALSISNPNSNPTHNNTNVVDNDPHRRQECFQYAMFYCMVIFLILMMSFIFHTAPSQLSTSTLVRFILFRVFF